MHHVRIFTLRFSPATERLDDSSVVGFLADKEVLSIRDHFFVTDDVPYLTLVVCYRAAPPSAHATGGKAGPSRDDSWRDQLTEADWPLFKTLRAWRSERCKQEGVPPYVICNNRQLTDIARKRPATLAALGEIDGFGEAKLKKYGQDLLTSSSAYRPKAISAIWTTCCCLPTTKQHCTDGWRKFAGFCKKTCAWN